MTILDLVLGPTVIGVLFNVFLYGTMCMQCYHYFIKFPEDSKSVRFLVWFLFIANTANTVFECIVLYEYTITDFGDFNAVVHGNWRSGTGLILAGIIAVAVQGFLTRRVQRLTKTLWLCVPIYVCVIVQFVAATSVGIEGSIKTAFAGWDEWEIKAPTMTWLVLAAVVDCAITSILTFYLRRSRTGFTSTDSMITGLIKFAVETGTITAIWAVLDLILYLSVPKPVHLIFNLSLPKLYSNTLMSTLNARPCAGGSDSDDGNGSGGSHSSHISNGTSIPDTTWKHRVHVSNVKAAVHVCTASLANRDVELGLGKKGEMGFVPSSSLPSSGEVIFSDDKSDDATELYRPSFQQDERRWASQDCVRVSTSDAAGIPGAHNTTSSLVHGDSQFGRGELSSEDAVIREYSRAPGLSGGQISTSSLGRRITDFGIVEASNEDVQEHSKAPSISGAHISTSSLVHRDSDLELGEINNDNVVSEEEMNPPDMSGVYISTSPLVNRSSYFGLGETNNEDVESEEGLRVSRILEAHISTSSLGHRLSDFGVAEISNEYVTRKESSTLPSDSSGEDEQGDNSPPSAYSQEDDHNENSDASNSEYELDLEEYGVSHERDGLEFSDIAASFQLQSPHAN